ncbi:hypothetical protein BV898_01459 [Hypsibius exemplaris]|uniref:Uncharacterized protein n=1 Tax=Hypsibius exemplaris TaxID=2072580 RepID=A0A1W0XBI4_HYPEX|nr:hypothetical protein BV898_01459 [Hypsibius exemplaris]
MEMLSCLTALLGCFLFMALLDRPGARFVECREIYYERHMDMGDADYAELVPAPGPSRAVSRDQTSAYAVPATYVQQTTGSPYGPANVGATYTDPPTRYAGVPSSTPYVKVSNYEETITPAPSGYTANDQPLSVPVQNYRTEAYASTTAAAYTVPKKEADARVRITYNKRPKEPYLTANNDGPINTPVEVVKASPRYPKKRVHVPKTTTTQKPTKTSYAEPGDSDCPCELEKIQEEQPKKRASSAKDRRKKSRGIRTTTAPPATDDCDEECDCGDY